MKIDKSIEPASRKKINKGIFPTMVTPFNDKKEIDYRTLSDFIEKFDNDGAVGLFAVCQSSEMFALSLEEQTALAAFVKKESRLQVVASGHTQTDPVEQLEAMKRMAGTGVDAVVLISNAFAGSKETDDAMLRSLDRFLEGFHEDVPLGIYECPYPYKRLLSEKVLKHIIDTERFFFLKDTSCDIEIIGRRLDITRNSDFGLYNANAETLAKSMMAGGSGYSGIHANISVKLLRRVMENPKPADVLSMKAHELLMELSAYLGGAHYPVSAKAMLVDMHIFKGIETRIKSKDCLTIENKARGKEILEKVLEFEDEFDNECKMRG
ncbi:MAG: dihydrodipicolinate synthase family protein [Clostridia bacterium]|nr:dihydrodipicolinate synthase family protein [Clostridia bacterium]